MRRILLLCSVVLVLALSGCGWFSSASAIHQMSDADSWDIPVVPQKVVQNAQDAVHGTEVEQPDMVITVPASGKPTVVEVRRIKRTIRDKMLTNKPAFVVKSDNQGVTAAQPKQTVWWKWIAAGVGCLLLVMLVVMVVAQKVANFSLWGFVMKLFKRG